MKKSFSILAVVLTVLLIPLAVRSANRDDETADKTLFTIGRIKYGGGGDWYTDPTTIPNLLRHCRERLNMETVEEEVVVDLTDPRSVYTPFLYITGHGNVKFNEAEVERLREILESGGFLFANDNGPEPDSMDASFRREMKRVFPDDDFVELPFDHPIYHSFYEFPTGLPKIHKHRGGPPKGFGLFHNGRMVCFYDWNTDIGNGLESPGVHPSDNDEIREEAIKMGINIVLYALDGSEHQSAEQ